MQTVGKFAKKNARQRAQTNGDLAPPPLVAGVLESCRLEPEQPRGFRAARHCRGARAAKRRGLSRTSRIAPSDERKPTAAPFSAPSTVGGACEDLRSRSNFCFSSICRVTNGGSRGRDAFGAVPGRSSRDRAGICLDRSYPTPNARFRVRERPRILPARRAGSPDLRERFVGFGAQKDNRRDVPA